MRKRSIIATVCGVVLALSVVVVWGVASGQRTEWWAAWGQWVGGVGSIAAAVVALSIARAGWRHAEQIAREGWDRAEAEHRRQENRHDAELAAQAAVVERERVRRDLDESRRVALMALSTGPTGENRAEVIATVVNALAYHSEILAPGDARVLLGQLNAGSDKSSDIQRLVDQLCEQRGDPPLFRQHE